MSAEIFKDSTYSPFCTLVWEWSRVYILCCESQYMLANYGVFTHDRSLILDLKDDIINVIRSRTEDGCVIYKSGKELISY